MYFLIQNLTLKTRLGQSTMCPWTLKHRPPLLEVVIWRFQTYSLSLQPPGQEQSVASKPPTHSG